MRKVTNRTETNISVDLPVNSEDAIQSLVLSHRPAASRQEPKRYPNTYRKIKEWNLEVIKSVVVVGDSNLPVLRMQTFK